MVKVPQKTKPKTVEGEEKQKTAEGAPTCTVLFRLYTPGRHEPVGLIDIRVPATAHALTRQHLRVHIPAVCAIPAPGTGKTSRETLFKELEKMGAYVAPATIDEYLSKFAGLFPNGVEPDTVWYGNFDIIRARHTSTVVLVCFTCPAITFVEVGRSVQYFSPMGVQTIFGPPLFIAQCGAPPGTEMYHVPRFWIKVPVCNHGRWGGYGF